MLRRVLIALSLVACGAPLPPARPPSSQGLAQPEALAAREEVTEGSLVEGEVVLHDGARGTLIIAWLTPEELADRGRALENVMVAVDRAVVVRGDRETVRFELRVPSEVARVQIVAWLDESGRGIEALFRMSTSTDPLELPASGPVRLGITTPILDPPRERCVAPDELVVLEAPRGSAGGAAEARLCVHLPRAYSARGSARRRFPVVYALPGLGGDHTNGIARAVGSILDQLPEGGGDAIVVGVETRTPFGSSYLVDSPLTGSWAGFLPERVVAEIDRRYRTIASRDGRAVVGHSTGGFDAVSIGLRRPDVFGLIGASSPDALDMEAWMLEPGSARARPKWLTWMRFEDRLGGAGQFTSYASAWSPEEGAPRGMRWPVDLESGAVVPAVWARWRAQSPITWLDDPEGLERARRMSDRIFLTCGTRDEPLLFEPTERFAAALARAGVEHAWVPTDYGHVGHGERFVPLVRYVIDRLAR